MKNLYQRKINYLGLVVVMLLGVTACGGGGSSSPATDTPSSVTYSTTSNRGDYSEWTLSGSSLNASWEVINTTGGVDYTYTIAASCGAADADNVHACTISTSSCADGVASCPTTMPSGNLDMMEVPGVALMIHTAASSGGDELHVGFVKNASACTDDVSGDYTYIRTGVGLQENFGMYNADANLIDVVHSDFGFDTTATSELSYSNQTVAYRSAASGVDMLVDGGCSNGVRQRTTSGGNAMRAMLTASGLFVLDMPAGQGGLLSFNVNKAASLTDFVNKSFSGIAFPDDGSPTPFHADFGTIASNKIDTSISLFGGTTMSIMALNTASGLTPPAYADFTVAPTGYTGSPLATTYPTPNDIPGLFKFGKLFDKGRVIVAAMKFNNKVIALGMVYNYRDAGFSFKNPATGNPFPGPGLYNSGNFILFEK
jgi:hypothetical protein